MGGHNAGEVASKLAVDTIIDYFKNAKDIESIRDEIEKSIIYANEKIYNLSKKEDGLNGMGTTVTASIIKNNKMVVANVGDSSCYIINLQNEIIKVTKDHSLVQQLVDNGSITEEEAVSHPNKNIITRALGTNSFVQVDTFELELANVKKIILCTDGLTNDISPQEMCDIIIKNSNKESCKLLIDMSKRNGGRDNISVIVFEGECKDDRYFTRK